ncbi:hypothetical protein C8P63_1164 [Melghirimyces profundicolus]|uniref:Uncharacterized protein n=1 Tax=Melghirimyces profundicolus TaxID=1242148 RepID=A0A2T6BQV0_9BACL|nr:hypothetical protein [Melghirimyces profundicolus]PTX58419.1 hypothetical protein C8P63_1164 [Melghirimyces profundicolus]
MHTQTHNREQCPVCGNDMEDRDAMLNECCSSHWIKRQIDNSYA